MATARVVTWYPDGGSAYQLFPRVSGGTYGDRLVVMPEDWGQAEVTQFLAPLPWGYGVQELGWVADKPRTISLPVRLRGGTEAKGWDAMRDLMSKVNPFGTSTGTGPGTLRLQAPGTLMTDVAMKCRVQALPAPSYGSGASFLGPAEHGHIVGQLRFVSPYPFLRNYAATTSANTAVTSTKATVNVVGSGQVPVGAKVTVVSVDSGTPTSMLIANATAGPDSESGGSLTWTVAGGFAANNSMDWRHTDPGSVTFTGSVTAAGFLVLWPWTTNAIELTLGGAGQVTVNIAVYWAWL